MKELLIYSNSNSSTNKLHLNLHKMLRAVFKDSENKLIRRVIAAGILLTIQDPPKFLLRNKMFPSNNKNTNNTK